MPRAKAAPSRDTIGRMQDPSAQPATEQELEELYDNPLERLQLLGSDDAAISAFLDELDVRGPREREMLRELARTSPLEQPDRFEADHRRVVARSRAFVGTATAEQAPAEARLLRVPIRFLVELVARYVVVSHVQERRRAAAQPLLAPRDARRRSDSRELALLHPARTDAQALVEITKSREIGVPTFVIGGLLIPAGISLWRLASGTVREWWIALLVGAIGVAIGLAISWFVLRGAALASRRIRLSVSQPLAELWRTIGNCGDPPEGPVATASRSSRSRSPSASGSCSRCS